MFHDIKYIGEVYCIISEWLKMTITFSREEVEQEVGKGTMFVGNSPGLLLWINEDK